MERAPKKLSNIFKLFLLFTVFLTVFTHLYTIQNTYIFQNDEGRDVLISLKMIQSSRPVLLGPETSVGNMYLGPFYYYLMVPALMLSNLDPVGPAIMVALLGIATTFLIFLLGSRYYSPKVGLIAAMFYAVSPIMLHHSRSSWNPNVIPFFISLLLLIPNYKQGKYQLFFGLLVGILFQLHYVALILPGLIFLGLSISYLKQKNYTELFRLIGIGFIGFMTTSLPFWLFELRHNFLNSSAFLTYIGDKTSSSTVYPPYLNRLYSNFLLLINGALMSSSLTAIVPKIATFTSIIIFIYTLIFHNSKNLNYLILSLIILSFLKESMNIHYLAFLFPLIAIWFGSLFELEKFPKFIVFILTIFLVYHFYPSLTYAFTRTENAPVKQSSETAAYILKVAAGRPYNVVGSQGTFTNTISYFLAISDNPPRNDLQTLVFDICQGGPCRQDEETTVLLYLTGPSHPSLIDYLGHPAINEFRVPRKIIKNERAVYDTYVATILLEP